MPIDNYYKININSKKNGKSQILSNIEIELRRGEIIGLIGINGAGKTTLFECIRNLTEYEGVTNIKKTDLVAYLPTSLYFYSNMTGLEYIEFFLAARKMKISLTEINAMNCLFNLPLKQFAMEYSTGMKKKLGFMALLLQKNNLFLLDEPFNGIDLASCILIKEILKRLKDHNKSILISSHIISSLTDICDSIIHLDNGKIRQLYKKEQFNDIEHRILEDSFHEKITLISNLEF